MDVIAGKSHATSDATADTAPGAGQARGRTGVLVMAHGTPASREGVEEFYTRIRRGRPPSPAQLADLLARYDAIGGTSPLAAVTRDQVRSLARLLEAKEPGRYVVRFGAKHTAPFIEEAAAELAEAGVASVVGLVLAPHHSSVGSEEYLERAGCALAEAGGPPLLPVRQWYDRPGFAELWAARVRAALGRLEESERSRAVVVFSAHSIPEQAVAAGDPYPEQVVASAARVAEKAGIGAWQVAWQSAGRAPGRWLGPALLEILPELAAGGCRAVVVCPVGFVADHLEVLYDLDVEASAAAARHGLGFSRAASLNDDPRLAELLAGAVRRVAAGVPDA